MTISILKLLLDNQTFHHATYRNHGTLWEGLHIYKKDPNGMRGFSHVGAFYKDNPELRQAESLVRGTGVSVGAYGAG